jgi:hypothetical protein
VLALVELLDDPDALVALDEVGVRPPQTEQFGAADSGERGEQDQTAALLGRRRIRDPVQLLEGWEVGLPSPR